MIYWDKNYLFIIIWLFGNEVFYGQNYKVMYIFVIYLDFGWLVYYEGDVQVEFVDMYLFMYLIVDKFIELVNI